MYVNCRLLWDISKCKHLHRIEYNITTENRIHGFSTQIPIFYFHSEKYEFTEKCISSLLINKRNSSYMIRSVIFLPNFKNSKLFHSRRKRGSRSKVKSPCSKTVKRKELNNLQILENPDLTSVGGGDDLN